METDGPSIDIVMEQLPIIPILIDYLSSDQIHLFKAALKAAGTILTSPNAEYSESLYKNDILQGLVIGWRRYEGTNHGPDIRKEIVWILGNMIASHSTIITKSIVDNVFIIEKLKEILAGSAPVDGSQNSIKIDMATRKETLHVFQNLVFGYGIEIHYDLVYRYNMFEVLLPYLQEEAIMSSYLIIPYLVLQILNNIFMKEQLIDSCEFYLMCEKMGGIDLIEGLQLHPQKKIYEVASEIIKNYGNGQQVFDLTGTATRGRQGQHHIGGQQNAESSQSTFNI
ncbi:hypothetical protein FGO68_gene13786 [Halteria grandinella]|uniref:Uncharacterized protein n=1 Tax=Halteria grandinella TaxID=5974 RepID=A0A8J8NF76_HALGN|nr:hypothetical protein FGO68_gene13786 [Halteria grandinella]